jgi:PilZ domain
MDGKDTDFVSNASPSKNRRLAPRVPGPFDGRRLGALSVALRIHDLSVGGCLIESYFEATVGRRIQIEIELPYAGWIRLRAEILYTRPDYGFAVKFVDVPDETRGQLERVIDRLLTQSPTEA